MMWIVGVIVVMCTACSYGLAMALHLGPVGGLGLSFVITMIVLNVSGVMRRF